VRIEFEVLHEVITNRESAAVIEKVSVPISPMPVATALNKLELRGKGSKRDRSLCRLAATKAKTRLMIRTFVGLRESKCCRGILSGKDCF
jgi:hypothetical protein